MWLKELILNSPWPGLPGIDGESHVNNVLMIYHLCLLPGLFLLPLCTHSQSDPFKIWIRYHHFSAQNLSTAPIPGFSWPPMIRPLPTSRTTFPTILSLICSATWLSCCSLTVPRTRLAPGTSCLLLLFFQESSPLHLPRVYPVISIQMSLIRRAFPDLSI